ncbi:MAG: tRNA dihydrouridine(20/20a) synthase DusA [Steroidobacteraceae bacterium]
MSVDVDRRCDDHRLCVAPMLDWTDRHCRYFLRLFSPRMWLYTEMVTTHALVRGRRDDLLAFDAAEQPLALQLGGSDPGMLASAARVAVARGYREINLNVGCPSDRVQNASFGACLMAKPGLVADCVRAMRAETDALVTVKTRIGIDDRDDYGFLRDFVGAVVDAGCRLLVVHARKALLSGLSPKQNREIPPLDHERVWQVKRDFPDVFVVVNGGLRSVLQASDQWRHADGVMVGREAYHNPYVLAALHQAAWSDGFEAPSPQRVVACMQNYAERELVRGGRLHAISRHMLGLMAGRPGARNWRRVLSEGVRNPRAGPKLLSDALVAAT